MKALAILLDASLLVLALVVLFLHEAHTPAMRAVLTVLLIVVSGRGLWRDYRAGLLSKSFSGLYTAMKDPAKRRHLTVLHGSAVLVGLVASVVSVTY